MACVVTNWFSKKKGKFFNVKKKLKKSKAKKKEKSNLPVIYSGELMAIYLAAFNFYLSFNFYLVKFNSYL